MSGKSRPALLVLGLTFGLIATNVYYGFSWLEQKRRSPYRQAGLSEEQITQFMHAHPKQNGNKS